MTDVENITLLDADGMRRALSRISYEIVERIGDLDDLVLIGIRTRGWHLAKRIAGKIEELEQRQIPHYDLDTSLYRDDREEGTERLQTRQSLIAVNPELAKAVNARSIVLVDDVLFTGRTVRAALDALTSGARPALIQLAVLVDRGHRELPIRPDYVGKNIPTASAERVQVFVSEVDGRDEVHLQKPLRSNRERAVFDQ